MSDLDDLKKPEAAPAGEVVVNDVRWAVNYLLEQIAKKFEGWDTDDIWKSRAAETVREFKHNLTTPPAITEREIIEKTVRYMRGHTEQFTWEGDPLTSPNPKGSYVRSVVPVGPFMRGSQDHHDKTTDMWVADAIAALAGGDR